MPAPRALARQAVDDLRSGVWRATTNALAGSPLLPGSVRGLLLRALGIDCRSVWVSSGVTITHHRLHIGRAAYVNEGVLLESAGGITIGAGALLGPRVCILTSTHDVLDEVETAPRRQPVVIGAGAWLGAQVVVLPGVHIGPGVVVGAGAVVTRDLLVPGTYAGVPARLLRPVQDAGASAAARSAQEDEGTAPAPA